MRPAQDADARLSLLGPAAAGGEADVDLLELQAALDELTAVGERKGAITRQARRERIKETCGGDADLRSEVEEILAYDASASTTTRRA